MSNSDITVKFGADIADVKNKLDQLIHHSEEMNGHFRKLGSSLRHVFQAVVIYEAAKKMAEFAHSSLLAVDTLNNLHQQTGLTVETLDALRYQSNRVNESFDAVQTGVQKLSKMFGELELGSEEAQQKFALFGITAKDLQGLTLDQKFNLWASKLGGMTTEMRNAVVSESGLGKSFIPLSHVLAEGAKTLDEAREHLSKTGLGISAEDGALAAKAAESLREISDIISRIGEKLAVELSPFIKAGADQFINWTESGRSMGEVVTDAVEGITEAVIRLAGELRKLTPANLLHKAQGEFWRPLVDAKEGDKGAFYNAPFSKWQRPATDKEWKGMGGFAGSMYAETIGKTVTDDDVEKTIAKIREQVNAIKDKAKADAAATVAADKAREAEAAQTSTLQKSGDLQKRQKEFNKFFADLQPKFTDLKQVSGEEVANHLRQIIGTTDVGWKAEGYKSAEEYIEAWKQWIQDYNLANFLKEIHEREKTDTLEVNPEELELKLKQLHATDEQIKKEKELAQVHKAHVDRMKEVADAAKAAHKANPGEELKKQLADLKEIWKSPNHGGLTTADFAARSKQLYKEAQSRAKGEDLGEHRLSSASVGRAAIERASIEAGSQDKVVTQLSKANDWLQQIYNDAIRGIVPLGIG